MENNRFRRAGSLADEPIQTNNTFLKPAGPLEEPLKINNTFFKPAGDLDNSSKNNSLRIEEIEMDFKSPQEIKDWLKTIVSGEKKSKLCLW